MMSTTMLKRSLPRGALRWALPVATALLLATVSARAADIVVIKGGALAETSSVPHRGGSMLCKVLQPETMGDAEWSAWRQIHMHGPVASTDALRLKQALNAIEIDEDVTSVTLSICSPGGLYREALRMHAAVREYSERTGLDVVTSAVDRGAWSAAAIVWLGGDVLQIVQDASAVGFDAPSDPRDLFKIDQLGEELRALITLSLERLRETDLAPADDATEHEPLRIDLDSLAAELTAFTDLAFSAASTSDVLALKSDFHVEIMEPARRSAFLASWSGAYERLIYKALITESHPLQRTHAEPSYARWYSLSPEHSRESTAIEVESVRMPVRSLGELQGSVVVPPHALIDWESPGFASPYREWGEYLFWINEEKIYTTTPLGEWLEDPVTEVPSYSNTLSKEQTVRRAKRVELLAIFDWICAHYDAFETEEVRESADIYMRFNYDVQRTTDGLRWQVTGKQKHYDYNGTPQLTTLEGDPVQFIPIELIGLEVERVVDHRWHSYVLKGIDPTKQGEERAVEISFHAFQPDTGEQQARFERLVEIATELHESAN